LYDFSINCCCVCITNLMRAQIDGKAFALKLTYLNFIKPEYLAQIYDFICLYPISVFRYPNYLKTLIGSVWILLEHSLLCVNPFKDQRSPLVTSCLKVLLSNLKNVLAGPSTVFHDNFLLLKHTRESHPENNKIPRIKQTNKQTTIQSTNSTAFSIIIFYVVLIVWDKYFAQWNMPISMKRQDSRDWMGSLKELGIVIRHMMPRCLIKGFLVPPAGRV